MKKFGLIVVAASLLAPSSPFAGELTAQQQDMLTNMAIQVLGPPPKDGYYHGASITSSLDQQPAGRHDCEPVDRKGNVVHGVNRGTWQRWRCPHIGNK